MAARKADEEQATIADAVETPKLSRNELRTARAGANLWAGEKFQGIVRELRRMPLTPEARVVYREVLSNYLRIVNEALVSEASS